MHGKGPVAGGVASFPWRSVASEAFAQGGSANVPIAQSLTWMPASGGRFVVRVDLANTVMCDDGRSMSAEGHGKKQ